MVRRANITSDEWKRMLQLTAKLCEEVAQDEADLKKSYLWFDKMDVLTVHKSTDFHSSSSFFVTLLTQRTWGGKWGWSRDGVAGREETCQEKTMMIGESIPPSIPVCFSIHSLAIGQRPTPPWLYLLKKLGRDQFRPLSMNGIFLRYMPNIWYL